MLKTADYEWRTVFRAGAPHKTQEFVSLRRSGIKLGVQFLREQQIFERNLTHCAVKVDDNRMAILLDFKTRRDFEENLKDNASADSWYELLPDGGARRNRQHPKTMIACSSVCALNWVKSVVNDRNFRKRRFLPTRGSENTQFIIQIVPSFLHRKEASYTDMPVGAKGIYCYLSSANDILYIGQGDLRDRFSRHNFQQNIPAATIMYTIVPDESVRLAAEAYHLRFYQTEHQKLPPFNRVGGWSAEAIVRKKRGRPRKK